MNIMYNVKKNDIIELNISEINNLGAGVSHLEDGRVVFVRGAVTGDKAGVTRGKQWVKLRDIELLDTAPEKVRSKAYDITLNGCEIGGGSVRIYQNDIQEKMFNILGFTSEEANDRFGFLLNAFKYGVPPHAGLAYGLDRLVMLMSKTDNIRDVIAFPKIKDASCLMTNAPDVVEAKQLEELFIKVDITDENSSEE